jgi:signal transduction histidine kinase
MSGTPATTEGLGARAGGGVYRILPVSTFEWIITVITFLVLGLRTLTGGYESFTNGSILMDLVFWISVIAVVELLHVPVWKSIQVSMGVPLLMAVAFLYPPELAGLVGLLSSSDPRELRHEVSLSRALFNRSQVALSVFFASLTFHALGGSLDSWSGVLRGAPAAVLVDFVVNTTLVSTLVSLIYKTSISEVRRKLRIGNAQEFLVSYVGLGLLGVLLARLYGVGWWAVAGFVLPLLLARQMFFRTRALEEATKELQDREVVLRALSNRMAEERQDERKAIAGYLHDDLAQVLYRMALHLDISEKQLEKGETHKAREEIIALRQSRNRAMELIRALIRDLHRSPLGRAGLTQSLSSYAHEVERDTGVRMRTELEDIEMAPPVQLLCYHVAREAVMNAVKHAEPSAITITLEPTPEGARLTVTDNGKGFDAEDGEPEGHYGLTMMRERAQVAGGTFKIRSAPGRGTSVTADFPTSWMVEPDGEARRASEAGARDAPA